MEKTIHHGRNIERFREMLGIKQEALALSLGEDGNQKKVSLLEAKEVVEEPLLQEVAKELRVPVEAIKNFDEETAIINIQNNYEGSNPGAIAVNGGNQNYHCTFNPLDKLIELVEKNERLYEELLKVEREKIALLERMLGNK